ncbi:MAG TPA: hypothetical protein VFP72_23200, partial [Kineosporiaceae bacterium]|nr:hypothetical protein [Kineosporiaceae bacterium]
VGTLVGPDIDPRTGALLSIAQLQAALRTGAIGRRRPDALTPAGAPAAHRQPPGPPVRADADPRTGGQGIVAAPARPAVPAWLSRLTPEPVMVVAAQPGAGCSTVAMAIADAASDRATVHLIEVADAAGSGLAAATRAELGSDPAGLWRRGRREQVLVSRACDLVPDHAPDLDAAATATVVDLGHPRLPLRPGALAGLPGPAVVAVCRASIPGITRLEVLLAAVQRPALVAVIGPARWAGPVRAVVGPGLRQAADAGAVVRIPCDRDLAMTGLTAHDLPRKVAAAGARLWQLATAAGTSPIQPHPKPQQIWTGEHQ